jgi:hypothetical protein
MGVNRGGGFLLLTLLGPSETHPAHMTRATSTTTRGVAEDLQISCSDGARVCSFDKTKPKKSPSRTKPRAGPRKKLREEGRRRAGTWLFPQTYPSFMLQPVAAPRVCRHGQSMGPALGGRERRAGGQRTSHYGECRVLL